MTTVEPGRAEDWAESVHSDFSTVNDAATIASLRAEVARLRLRHHERCFQRRPEGVPADLPADLCDCRTLWTIEGATRVMPRAEAAEAERDALVAAMRRIGDEYDAEVEPLRDALDAVRALAGRWTDEFDDAADRGEAGPVHGALLGAAQAIEDALARVSPEGREDTPNPEGGAGE